MIFDDIFLDRWPSIDLHGYDRDSARVAVNDFVVEAVKMGYEKIVIVHGIGQGIVSRVVQETLGQNKQVVAYHIDGRNNGCTVASIRVD